MHGGGHLQTRGMPIRIVREKSSASPVSWSLWNAIAESAKKKTMKTHQPARQALVMMQLTLSTALGAPAPDRIDRLPGLPPGEANATAAYAGYLGDTPLFYWLVEPGDPLRSARLPLVLWLQGGPGASSLYSLFGETGPWRLNPSPTGAAALEPAGTSWLERANLLYLDQPVGTGFSFRGPGSPYASTEAELAAAAADALAAFVDRHPRYVGHPLFIFGESFAGHMAPHIATALLRRSGGLKLEGLAIGDGWVDPVHQNLAFPEYAFGTGLIGADLRDALRVQAERCAATIRAGRYVKAFETDCYYHLLNPIVAAAGNVSAYDIRRFNGGRQRGLTDDLGAYLGRPDVRRALGIPTSAPEWGSQSGGVETALIADLNAPTSLPLWPGLVAAGVPILAYSGNMDLICNHEGTAAYLDALGWPGYTDAERLPWRLGEISGGSTGDVVGWFRSGGNLSHAVVANAGHMAPADQPVAMADLLRRFLKNPAAPFYR